MANAMFRTGNRLYKASVGTSGRPPKVPVGSFQPFAPCSARTRARVVPRAAEAEPVYSLPELVQKRKELELELAVAVRGEDFREAARLKAALQALAAVDPVAAATRELQQAIAEERYADAAAAQARIRALEAELGPAALQCGLLSTSSNTVTRGIRVQVSSFYLPAQSNEAASRFMFAYHVVLTNEGEDIVQLRARHWAIMDGRGKVEEVRGPGVIGEQPILLPGKSYDYTSGCPLTTPQGSMEGEYTMAVLRPEDGQFADTMEVKIGKFKLDVSGPRAV